MILSRTPSTAPPPWLPAGARPKPPSAASTSAARGPGSHGRRVVSRPSASVAGLAKIASAKQRQAPEPDQRGALRERRHGRRAHSRSCSTGKPVSTWPRSHSASASAAAKARMRAGPVDQSQRASAAPNAGEQRKPRRNGEDGEAAKPRRTGRPRPEAQCRSSRARRRNSRSRTTSRWRTRRAAQRGPSRCRPGSQTQDRKRDQQHRDKIERRHGERRCGAGRERDQAPLPAPGEHDPMSKRRKRHGASLSEPAARPVRVAGVPLIRMPARATTFASRRPLASRLAPRLGRRR